MLPDIKKPKDPQKKQESTECPYRMSDARFLTDYRPRCTVDYQYKISNSFKSSYDERQFLIHNAVDIMKDNMKNVEKISGCKDCFSSDEQGTILPEKNMIQCDSNKCKFSLNNQNGIGTGRNYNL
jgi:hypothetical protein